MNDWKEYRLTDIAEIVSERVSMLKASIDTYITTENMKNNFGGIKKAEKMPLTSSVNSFSRNDVLFSNIRTYFKKVWLSKFSGTVSPDVLVFRPKKGKCESRFLYYLLCSPEFTEYSVLTSKGAKMPRGDKDALKTFRIDLPPLPEQTAIAAVLSSLDDKIDLLQRQNATLEKIAETLFRQWFVEEAKEEWEYQLNLGDLIESVSITHKFPNPTIVFLNTSDIHLGNVLEHNPTDVKGLPGQAKKSIQKDDILFSEIRPANGRWAFIEFDAENYVVSTKLMVLRSKNIVSQAFVYFYLTNTSTVDWLQMIAESRSGTFPQITFDQIKDLKISIPSEEIFNNTIVWCEATLKKMKSNQTQIRTLTALRDSLLPKLMSGEVRVQH